MILTQAVFNTLTCVKVLKAYENDSGRYLVCGTNAYKPVCRDYVQDSGAYNLLFCKEQSELQGIICPSLCSKYLSRSFKSPSKDKKELFLSDVLMQNSFELVCPGKNEQRNKVRTSTNGLIITQDRRIGHGEISINRMLATIVHKCKYLRLFVCLNAFRETIR